MKYSRDTQKYNTEMHFLYKGGVIDSEALRKNLAGTWVDEDELEGEVLGEDLEELAIEADYAEVSNIQNIPKVDYGYGPPRAPDVPVVKRAPFRGSGQRHSRTECPVSLYVHLGKSATEHASQTEVLLLRIVFSKDIQRAARERRAELGRNLTPEEYRSLNVETPYTAEFLESVLQHARVVDLFAKSNSERREISAMLHGRKPHGGLGSFHRRRERRLQARAAAVSGSAKPNLLVVGLILLCLLLLPAESRITLGFYNGTDCLCESQIPSYAPTFAPTMAPSLCPPCPTCSPSPRPSTFPSVPPASTTPSNRPTSQPTLPPYLRPQTISPSYPPACYPTSLAIPKNTSHQSDVAFIHGKRVEKTDSDDRGKGKVAAQRKQKQRKGKKAQRKRRQKSRQTVVVKDGYNVSRAMPLPPPPVVGRPKRSARGNKPSVLIYDCTMQNMKAIVNAFDPGATGACWPDGEFELTSKCTGFGAIGLALPNGGAFLPIFLMASAANDQPTGYVYSGAITGTSTTLSLYTNGVLNANWNPICPPSDLPYNASQVAPFTSAGSTSGDTDSLQVRLVAGGWRITDLSNTANQGGMIYLYRPRNGKRLPANLTIQQIIGNRDTIRIPVDSLREAPLQFTVSPRTSHDAKMDRTDEIQGMMETIDQAVRGAQPPPNAGMALSNYALTASVLNAYPYNHALDSNSWVSTTGVVAGPTPNMVMLIQSSANNSFLMDYMCHVEYVGVPANSQVTRSENLPELCTQMQKVQEGYWLSMMAKPIATLKQRASEALDVLKDVHSTYMSVEAIKKLVVR